jgi:hypothetical protein
VFIQARHDHVIIGLILSTLFFLKKLLCKVSLKNRTESGI